MSTRWKREGIAWESEGFDFLALREPGGHAARVRELREAQQRALWRAEARARCPELPPRLAMERMARDAFALVSREAAATVLFAAVTGLARARTALVRYDYRAASQRFDRAARALEWLRTL